MGKLLLPRQHVFCPLCDEPMFSADFKMPNGNYIKAYFCKSCNVSILSIDPMFNKWRDTDKIIKCPECGSKMRWFGRMIDCYVKMECPDCGICVEKDSDMAIDPKRGVEIEDMDQPQPEVFDIQIPIDKLNLSPDKKAQLKQKIKKKREHDGK